MNKLVILAITLIALLVGIIFYTTYPVQSKTVNYINAN
jgi:hypothetical protein